MNLDKAFNITDTQENNSEHPMGLAVMATVLPSVAVKIMNRRFGLDGKHPPMSNQQVSDRYGLPVNVVNTMIGASLSTITEMGIDNTSK